MCYGKVRGVCAMGRSVVYVLWEGPWCMCYCNVHGVCVIVMSMVYFLL